MDYLYEVDRLTRDALFQENVVVVCEHHKEVLIYQGNPQAENTAILKAEIWIKERVGSFMRADVRDVVKRVIESAAKGECPKCASRRAEGK
jgi:hypothetical protein